MARRDHLPAYAAAAFAAASAVVSLYWTAGGTWLLDTVGGRVEELARRRSPRAVAVGASAVVLKVAAAGLALALVRGAARSRRLVWAPSGLAAARRGGAARAAAAAGGMNPAVAGTAIDALERVPLFAELDPEELQALAGAMHERAFRAGETVTAEGEAGDGFFVVERGEAEVTVDGEPRGTLGPGDHFGEIALLMGSERTATVTATRDLDCHLLTSLDFRALVEGDPAIAWKLLQSMAQRLA